MFEFLLTKGEKELGHTPGGGGESEGVAYLTNNGSDII
jgi:hypothetical protein